MLVVNDLVFWLEDQQDDTRDLGGECSQGQLLG